MDYFLTPQRTKELYRWLSNWPMWMNELGMTYTPSYSALGEIPGSDISDPTGKQAIRLQQYKTNCQMIEDSLRIALVKAEDRPHVISFTAKGTTYDDLVDRFGLTTAEGDFKSEVTRFLYYLDRVLAGCAI